MPVIVTLDQQVRFSLDRLPDGDGEIIGANRPNVARL